ncbi:Box C/D snoRNA protein 1 [Babesia caballi]|uniref:Box C/D snoRNA protein 1 n=1 Tax=Babesia caballi TaxID=5871 RepID=A0AAV4M019_BABCB|nr:Box C/D snoRNA protein 1 [Babesia caballi]
MSDETLSRDLAFLDEVSRVLESTSRAFVQRQLTASASSARRAKLGALRKCCADRGVQLLLCPPTLARHRRNHTTVRKGTVFWTVEWYFAEPDVALFDRRFNERHVLSAALERALSSVRADDGYAELLSGYRVLSNVAVLLRNLDTPMRDPQYYECNMDGTLQDNIVNTKVLEFPRFYVALKKDLHLYKIVERPPVFVRETPPDAGVSSTAVVAVDTDADQAVD